MAINFYGMSMRFTEPYLLSKTKMIAKTIGIIQYRNDGCEGSK